MGNTCRRRDPAVDAWSIGGDGRIAKLAAALAAPAGAAVSRGGSGAGGPWQGQQTY